jgi:Arc/MetJ-type ribon-helix-helix transcriptional regulator
MKRTTVTLPDELARAAEREAHRRRVSLSEVVREALFAHLDVRTGGPRPLPFVGLGDSGHRSTARDFEEILEAEWARDRGR